jgi:ribosomal protein L11 methylase PrmA
MRIRLSSGDTILASPQFFWEKRVPALLRIKTWKTFHPCHATTGLCLEILVDNLRRRAFKHVLDVGCGSGVLALTAAKMGVPMVVGVDLDPRSIACSRENAYRNGLEGCTHWLLGSTAALRSCFDCVLANLPRPELEALWDELVRLVAPNGRFIVSGVQDVDIHGVRELIRSRPLKVLRRLSRDQSLGAPLPTGSYTWVAYEMIREAGS